MAPSTGQKNASSSVSVLLNIAGVEAKLQNAKGQQKELDDYSQVVTRETSFLMMGWPIHSIYVKDSFEKKTGKTESHEQRYN